MSAIEYARKEERKISNHKLLSKR